MSLFVEFKIPDDGIGAGAGSRLGVSWCKVDSVLAVSSNDSKVRFYREEGDPLEEATLDRSQDTEANVSAMAWRTRSKVLAAGWEDGMLSLWNLKDRVLRTNAVVHSEAITIMQWSPEGTRLLSADSGGVVAVWKTDHRSRLTLVSRYQRKDQEAITCAAWAITPGYREAQKTLPTPPSCAFVATKRGAVVALDLDGNVVATADEETCVKHLLWFEQMQRLVCINSDCMLTQYKLVPEAANLELVSKVKLSMTAQGVRSGIKKAIWTGPSLLTLCAEENMVRFFDLATDKNYFLSLQSVDAASAQGKSVVPPSDQALNISYNPRKHMLAASTVEGRVCIWKFSGELGDHHSAPGTGKDRASEGSSASDWVGVNVLKRSNGPAPYLQWAFSFPGLALGGKSQCSIHMETELNRTLRNDVAAMQVSANTVLVHRGASTKMKKEVGMRIKGIAVNDTHLVVWNNEKVEVYAFEEKHMELVSSFPSKSLSIALHGQTIFQTNGLNLDICNLQGVVRKTIAFTEQEGEPALLNINNKYMAVATSQGYLKVYDVSRAEPKPVGRGAKFELKKKTPRSEVSVDIRSIKCNAAGTRISILTDLVQGTFLCEPDTCVHVWNADRNDFQRYDFGPHRYPVSHFWDGQEPKLFACETKRRSKKATNIESILNKTFSSPALNTGRKQSEMRESERTTHEIEVVTLFATDENMGIMMQDSFPLDRRVEGMLGIKIPRLFFITKPIDSGLPRLEAQTMRDFIGLEVNLEDETKRALVDFSYYLTIGNMDEAYRAVRLVKDSIVWENMAPMCVKTKRLDVAEACFGAMRHARGSRALTEAIREQPELEAKVAAVAIQLGLLEDAERLYIECERFDLLTKLLVARGHYERALEVAHDFDRIHLRSTHFQYAKALEVVGDTEAAIKNYEASNTHCRQVPRMLFEAGKLEDLERYINELDDLTAIRWWGQYLESIGAVDKAIQTYRRVQDASSLVRVYCYLGDMDAAKTTALNSSNKLASFLLAKKCEQIEDIRGAIDQYSRAGKYNQAVRLARVHGYNDELVNLALRSSKRTMMRTAVHLEKVGMLDKAVILFHKSGSVTKALELCFQAQLFDQLASISDSLCNSGADENVPASSPETLARCAEFFMQNRQFAKAVNLYVAAQELETALDVCFQHDVPIDEALADKMSLPRLKKAVTSGMAKTEVERYNKRRTDLLERLAECCKKQKSFQLAMKKYYKAGKVVKGMKCLRESGDTRMIIKYAKMTKKKEVYILAANYLQLLDWRQDGSILESIKAFYTQAHAYEQLSRFYHECANEEIRTYKNYASASAALKESIKYINRSNSDEKASILSALQQRSSVVDRFLQAQELLSTDSGEGQGESILHSLLGEPEPFIPPGDIYAELVQHLYEKKDLDHAYRFVERMQSEDIDISMHLDAKVVEDICKAVGMDRSAASALLNRGKYDEEDDGVEEEIEESISGSWEHKH